MILKRIKRAAAIAGIMMLPFLAACTGRHRIPQKQPLKENIAVLKPARRAFAGKWRVASTWKHGECSIDGDNRMEYTYRAGGGETQKKEYRRPERLFPSQHPPLALKCSEDSTLILWPYRLEISMGAQGVYFGQYEDIMNIGTNVWFWRSDPAFRRAIGGMFSEDNLGAVVVHENMDVSFWDWRPGKNDYSRYSLSEDGGTASEVVVKRNGKGYLLHFPGISITYYVEKQDNGGLGIGKISAADKQIKTHATLTN